MSLLDRRRKVVAAERRLVSERALWRERTAGIRAGIARHREAYIVGGGFLAGILASLLPLRGAGRVGGFLAGAASFALRSPIGAMLMDGVARHGAAAAQAAAAPPTSES